MDRWHPTETLVLKLSSISHPLNTLLQQNIVLMILIYFFHRSLHDFISVTVTCYVIVIVTTEIDNHCNLTYDMGYKINCLEIVVKYGDCIYHYDANSTQVVFSKFFLDNVFSLISFLVFKVARAWRETTPECSGLYNFQECSVTDWFKSGHVTFSELL